LCITEEYTDQVAIVRPGAELHETRLFVEWEVLDINLTERLVDGRRFPHHFARVIEDGLRHYGHLVVSVGTETHYRLLEEALFSIKLDSPTAVHELQPHQVGEIVESLTISLKLSDFSSEMWRMIAQKILELVSHVALRILQYYNIL
jgi:hypothetical protein